MIQGRLSFDSDDITVDDQKVIVMVQDTSRAGSGAVDIARTELTLPAGFDCASDTLPFALDVPHLPQGSTIRAHLTRHGGADIQIGDMITTQSIPVQEDAEIDVPLRRVR